MGQNIGPETRVPSHKRPQGADIYYGRRIEEWVNGEVDTSIAIRAGMSVCPNGEMYYHDRKSFMSEMVEMIYSGRKEDKRNMFKHEKRKIAAKDELHHRGVDIVVRGVSSVDHNNDVSEMSVDELLETYVYNATMEVMYDVKQMTKKILINSLYGALANQYFKYGMIENAEAITLQGQLVNKYTQRRTNAFLNEMLETQGVDYCIMGDTDSNYYDVSTIADLMAEPGDSIQDRVDKIDHMYKTILGPEIDSYMVDLAKYVNSYANKMVWEREAIASSCIIVAKKNYVMAVWDNEGVRYHDEPKLKVIGLEAVKSTTPEWSREMLKQCYMIALEKDESDVQEAITDAYRRMSELPVEEIAITTSISNVGKYCDPSTVYVKGCTQNARAAITHNEMAKNLGLDIDPITDGDKFKWVPLQMPNPTGQPVMGFIGYLNEGFGITPYIDYATIFEKSFKKPITRFLSSMGWSVERTHDALDFLL